MTNRRELALILFFCLAAALRVFIFSAGFPFFSNIDEDLHFDVIMQYSHARLPRSFDLLKEETLEWIVPYASPEFRGTPDQFPDAKFPPPLWKQPPDEAAPELAATKAAWSTEANFESLPATALLRFGECLVADRATYRINRNPIIVLDSFLERSTDRNRGLAGLRNRAHTCA
jgi:hypothetical protein